MCREQAGAGSVIFDGVFDLDHARFTDVHTDDWQFAAMLATQGLQAFGNYIGTLVVEAHSIDQSSVSNQTEQSRLFVAALGNRSHGSNLDVRET